nr:MAG TPA: hypothetical protein [Caudoviricetes sp.]
MLIDRELRRNIELRDGKTKCYIVLHLCYICVTFEGVFEQCLKHECYMGVN